MRNITVPIGDLPLRSGALLRDVQQQVTISGSQGAPVALVAHALTGDANPLTWWQGMCSAGGFLDPARWCIIGINALGSCYGSTGAQSRDFPDIAVADIVEAQARTLTLVGIDKLALVIGGSLGGMQALQWALAFPQRAHEAVVIGAHDHATASIIALNALQREALELDERRGLALARKIAMLSYKSDELLAERHERRADRRQRFRYDVEGYLQYHADALLERMNPHAYRTLSLAMDSFDVRDFPISGQVPPVQFVGISSDRLFRAADVHLAAQRLRARGVRTEYSEFRSHHGHDAFLAQARELSAFLLRTRARAYAKMAAHR